MQAAWGGGVAQILQDHQQPDPQVFDHFGIGGFIGFATLVGLKTDLSDLGRIAQKFPAVCGQRAIPIRPPQPQSVEQTLAPGAQRIGSLTNERSGAIAFSNDGPRTTLAAAGPPIDCTKR